jgi:alanyl aminopeptidase
MPNAMGNGYYQWALADSGYQQLTRSLDQLKPTGQMSLASSIEAAYGAAKIHTATLMKSLAPLARSKHNPVAEEPMGDISFAREHLVDKDTRGAVEAYARKLYSPYNVAGDFKQGGAPDNANQRQFEAKVAGFLAHTGQDKAIHKAADHAAERLLGMGDNDKPNLRAVAPDFIPVVLRVAVHDEGKPVFDKLDAIFNKAKRPLVRSAALRAMASAKQPKLAKKVRAMALDPDVTKRNEVRTILYGQIFQPETRDATWKWIKSNYGKLSKRMPGSFGGRIPAVAGAFCSDKKANEVKAFFKGKLEAHPGSKRTLAQAMERAHLCAAMKKAQQASAEEFFSQM